jgi:hypothetical protein
MPERFRRENGMDEKTVKMVREWVELHRGNTEQLARWMRDSLRLGTLPQCRELVRQAMEAQP